MTFFRVVPFCRVTIYSYYQSSFSTKNISYQCMTLLTVRCTLFSMLFNGIRTFSCRYSMVEQYAGQSMCSDVWEVGSNSRVNDSKTVRLLSLLADKSHLFDTSSTSILQTEWNRLPKNVSPVLQVTHMVATQKSHFAFLGESDPLEIFKNRLRYDSCGQ